jgi:hypothetical protein
MKVMFVLLLSCRDQNNDVRDFRGHWSLEGTELEEIEQENAMVQ